MNTLLNKKWMAWVLIMLFILNISMLGTILGIFFLRSKKAEPELPQDQRFSGRELIEKASFDSTQVMAFHKLRQDFIEATQADLERLDMIRRDVIGEMDRREPDTNYLMELADSIGKVQAEIKKATLRHYRDVSRICNPEQKEMVKRYYTRMFFREGQGQGKMMRKGKRHGQADGEGYRFRGGRPHGEENHPDTGNGK
ncbi:MAG TPA: hypothetical protein P5531_02590 [Bacteroidales bacterium]|nr:hypothetical protein [Bacteroidales bacterium]HSA43182.1 hypothetical protein [Bacteroidales bacterium]